MNAVLDQLGIDSSFFIQLVIFAVVFVLLSHLYFKPFLKLFEVRHQRTVEDKEAAEKLVAQAEAKFEEYQRQLQEARMAARTEYEAVLDAAKREEAAILAAAREEAKKITQEAVDSIARQRDQLKKSLEADIERMAQGISEKLLSRKI